MEAFAKYVETVTQIDKVSGRNTYGQTRKQKEISFSPNTHTINDTEMHRPYYALETSTMVTPTRV